MTQLHVNKVRSLQSLGLTSEPITIGRASGNQVVLPSKRVSREHCVIEVVDEGAFRVRDLGSRHGTTVNGQRVSECRLGPGDVIGVGAFEITLDDPMAPSSSGLALRVADTASTRTATAATADLATARRDVERRVAELTKQLERAEKKNDDLARELETTRERQERMIEELTRARDAAEGDAETQRRRGDSREAELDAARVLADKTDRQLQSQTHALDDALARAAGLETRVAESEAAQRETAEESRAAERSMARLREAIGELHACSERVTVSHENLGALEGLWLEADERLQESAEAGELDLADSLQRDAISNHLEEAHAECESTVAELQEVALGLCRLIATDEAGPLPAAARRATRRRTSMFRRSSRA